MPLLSIREFDKLKVGELNPSTLTISHAQAEALVGLKRSHGIDVFKFVNRDTLSAQQFVGAVQVGNLCIEILPKVEGIDGTTMRRNLVAMLDIALDLDISEGELASVGVQSHGILEIFIRLFCHRLFSQVRRGLSHRYEAREENLAVLRGRLDIATQVRRNAANPERLHCRYDEFVVDNPLNQVLKTALRLLLQTAQDLRNQRKLSELLLMFDEVSDIRAPSLPWPQISFDRTNLRFRPCFTLAELFLKQSPPDVTTGRVSSLSLFFNMNELFEKFIANLARRTFRPCGFDVRHQGPRRYLAQEEGTHRDVFSLIPDVTAYYGHSVAWILDTKWKELTPLEARDNVAQSDMYQMYAYAHRFHCKTVILVYPHHAGLGEHAGLRSSYMIDKECLYAAEPTRHQSRILVATIDLAEIRTVPEQLRSLILG